MKGFYSRNESVRNSFSRYCGTGNRGQAERKPQRIAAGPNAIVILTVVVFVTETVTGAVSKPGAENRNWYTPG
jgi:hypothetical protein